MRWFTLGCIFLFSMGNVQAFAYEDASMEIFSEGEMLSLDGEIEDLLDEDFATEMGMDQLDLTILDQQTQPYHEQAKSSLELKNEMEQVDEVENSQISIEINSVALETTPLSSSLNTIKQETAKSVQAIEINLKKVFSGAPVIYSVLFLLSTLSVCVWLYSMLTIRSVEFLPPNLVKELRSKLVSNQFDEALDLCVKEKHFFCKMLASGILARKHGLSVMLDTMKAEGKRSTVAFWQRIGILNEIAVIAPMLGLLGTVLGMFYAFYDLNRSIESVSLLFDGLGISVGTTVVGLLVAILAMILYSLSKYRLVRILANVENEAQTFATLIDTSGPNYLNK